MAIPAYSSARARSTAVARTTGGSEASWRRVLRRSLRRSLDLLAASVLLLGMVFLAVSLATYHQTDPSPSTAAGGPVLNWLGLPGAFVAERALFLFGPVSVLLLPLMYVFAQEMWRLAEVHAPDHGAGDEDSPPPRRHWLRTTAVLCFAMALLCTALALAFSATTTSLPASMGGLTGLLGAAALRSGVAYLPAAMRGWAMLGGGLLALALGAGLAARVFALDWAGLLSLPLVLRRRIRQRVAEGAASQPRKAAAPGPRAPVVPETPRKPPEISDGYDEHQAAGRSVRPVRAALARPVGRPAAQFRAQG